MAGFFFYPRPIALKITQAPPHACNESGGACGDELGVFEEHLGFSPGALPGID